MREKNSRLILFIRLNTINIALFILIFGIAFTVNFMDFKHKFTSSFIHNTGEKMSSNFFLYLMSSEIGQLKAVNDEENIPSIPRILFTSMTNIWPDDIRTFLGGELPGFSSYNTEIAVAGYGTNLTNLPVESAPPLEVLLKEIEGSEKELSSKPDSNSGQESPPTPKTGENVVFVYHSHSWEAFAPLLNGINNPDEAVSINEDKNIIVVGKRLQEELIKRGIGTSQSTANVTEELQKKNWNYNHSYELSRGLVQEAIATEDTINYLIDIHRDSQPKKITTTTINGESFARLFFIVGKENKNYEANVHLAKELHQKLEEKYPGISRGVFIKGKDEGNGVYNQDLTDKSMLLEFGGVENNMEELNHSIEAFAEVFSEYYWNAEEVSGNPE
ncbi:stage II sporulation protein P [Bacillus sp. V3B]|uniref:stage II sporulation protein P n=1 Tax=Bacillus sp. V3B TaxID=2804915 RepID=UPI00210B3B25|nr:stage II sporulation protein P [Bacillus sp. V3B]MCQ6274546.1 stage II sporulation protein P [Bacillus sp. V3B]